jgi:amino-acid N-acetyltransferase
MASSEPTQKFQLRRAAVEDLDPLIDFLKPFVDAKHILPRNVGELQLLLANGFVAESEAVMIGFAAVEVYSPKMAEIQCLAVDSAYRRVGIGRELVQLCVERARDLKIRELMAITVEDAFLVDCGFDYSLPNQKRALFIETWSPDGE